MSYKDKIKQAEYNRRYYWRHRHKLCARQSQRYRDRTAKESSTYCQGCGEILTWRVTHQILDRTLVLCVDCYYEALRDPGGFYMRHSGDAV